MNAESPETRSSEHLLEYHRLKVIKSRCSSLIGGRKLLFRRCKPQATCMFTMLCPTHWKLMWYAISLPFHVFAKLYHRDRISLNVTKQSKSCSAHQKYPSLCCNALELQACCNKITDETYAIKSKSTT